MSAETEKSEVAKREEGTLAFWNERRIFEKTLEKDSIEVKKRNEEASKLVIISSLL